MGCTLVDGGIKITFTPTRHFQGEDLHLYQVYVGGWALQSEDANIWFSGDSGYGSHFPKRLAKRLGPFDIGFIECGQYCKDWHKCIISHEGIQAAKDGRCLHCHPCALGGFQPIISA